MQQWTLTCMKSPRAKHTFYDYSANSLVGDSISTCGSRYVKSTDCSAPSVNTQVFPVPLWLCTITSRLLSIGKIALYCTADGLLNP